MTTATESVDPNLTMDSEQQSLPVQGPAIEAARALFTPEESEDNHEPGNILEIIRSCLKEIKKHNTRHAIKMISQLTAVSEYIKLRARYQKHNACKRPCLSASMAIARRMGKGPYFARQIRHNEMFLLQNKHLPPPKTFVRHGHHSLLDNEALLHNIRVYLATQALGNVSPRILCQHVNSVILPALGINGTIVESTAQRWLRSKLGYECKEAKKGIYVDGHERPDVIEERKVFVEQILNRFERYVEHVQCPKSRRSRSHLINIA
jgi:hypothetical protein